MDQAILKALMKGKNFSQIKNFDKTNFKSKIKNQKLKNDFSNFSAKQSDAQSQVNLALVWNRSDVARQQIFIAENRAAWQAKTFLTLFSFFLSP